MIRTQMFIALALVSGVAIGYIAKPERAGQVVPVSEEDVTLAELFSDNGEYASITALRARVAELEALLAESAGGSGEQSVAVQGSDEADRRQRRTESERRGPPTADEMRERFARMEREDPVRFAQMTNHFAQMRQRRIDRAVSKMDFLSSVDTSDMSAAARKTHEDLQDLIARREELEERMHDRSLTDSERRQVFDEMREADMLMRELNQAERDNLILQTAKAVGMQDEDASDMVSTISEIIQATDGGRMNFAPPPPPDR